MVRQHFAEWGMNGVTVKYCGVDSTLRVHVLFHLGYGKKELSHIFEVYTKRGERWILRGKDLKPGRFSDLADLADEVSCGEDQKEINKKIWRLVKDIFLETIEEIQNETQDTL